MLATTKSDVLMALSPNALTVLESRYLIRDDEGFVTEAPAELFRRVAHTVAAVRTIWGATQDEVADVEEKYLAMMASGSFLPNSPTLMNAGRKLGMLSACFVLPLEDSIEDIMKTATDIALVQKAGGGTGIDLSRLRPAGSIVSSSGGTTDGPLSFLRMLSAVTTAIQQGAFRRGANMGVLRVDHPDIVAFVNFKSDLSEVTNYNLSVAMLDTFMATLTTNPSAPHVVVDPHLGREGFVRKDTGEAVYGRDAADPDIADCYTVGELWDRITRRAWETGEPGLVFIDEINRGNATPHIGQMRATNPCGEQPLLAHEGCNLGSINLAAFYCPETGQIDRQALAETVTCAVGFLDDVIEANKYPTEDIREACHANRRIGLGVMGFADLLFLLGIPYDSEQALEFAAETASFIRETAWDASTALAGLRGTFPNWNGSNWDVVHGREMRNAQVTTIAPTGTISIIAGCSGGIEPVFSLAFVRQVLEGKTLQELNPVFLESLKEHVQDDVVIQRVLRHASERGTIQDSADVPGQLKQLFRTARDVALEWHVRMQAVWQKYTDAAVSKTINLPADATVQDVNDAYLLGHELRLKGLTVYRDGSRATQPMALADANGKTSQLVPPLDVKPVDLPELMPSVRIKQRSPLGNLHAHISVELQTGREREVFAQLGKAGELAGADLEAICRLVSMLLRVGVELRPIVEQLDGIGSSLSLPSRDGRVMSLPDALAQALSKYLQAKDAYGLRQLLLGEAQLQPLDTHVHMSSPYKLKCPQCNSPLVFEEACAKCYTCGFSQC